MSEEIGSNDETLRICKTPWKGHLVLACRKCQKKLRSNGKKTKLAKLGKVLRKLARREESGPSLHVVDVSCLKLCPKGGVTVCTAQQLGKHQCSIVRTTSDLRQLLHAMPGADRGE